ncbi:phage minor capsid protein [Clostridium baratii]|uniref:phage minor capsid protein n=1 Tax=Clostridium baratii TaxID=1561 RepID=UPI0030CCAE1A
MALTPEQLKNLPEGFVLLYQELEDFIIEDISRRMAKAGKVTDTAKWQAIKAKEIGIALEDIKKKIKEINNISESDLKELLNYASEKSIKQDNEIYTKAGLDPLKIKGNKALESIVNSAFKQTAGELFNLTASLGFATTVGGKIVYKDIAKYYHKALDLAVLQISSGTLDYNTAIRNAIKELSNSGIRYIDYESGWSNSIEAAVRRAVMTGSSQMAQKLTLEGIEQMGAEYVETTAHAGARPTHAEWQGQVFCYKGKSDKYPDFVESTGYGTGDGLGGWNCRHNFFPFYPGITSRAYSDKDLKNIDPPPFEYNGKNYTYYEATQKQRAMERAIRKTKKELIGYNAAGLNTDFKNASVKLKQQERKYKEFSKVADIPTEKDRLQVLGFNRNVAQKSVWANKK